MQRFARLPQRQIERGAVERPAAVQARDIPALRRLREQVEGVDELTELAQGVVARQIVDRAGLLQRHVIGRVVDHVLADALVPGALQVHDSGQPLKAA